MIQKNIDKDMFKHYFKHGNLLYFEVQVMNDRQSIRKNFDHYAAKRHNENNNY